jgi:SAM-dependent methyltransferase
MFGVTCRASLGGSMAKREEYPLGYSEGEARRLENQAVLAEHVLRDTLHRAGLDKGMRVLDLGCGVGDVSFLAARTVGSTGSVVGVDRAAPSIARAQRRAADSEIHNVKFELGDLNIFRPNGTFDAVIGRFILLYLPDPSGLLRRLRASIGQGGIFAMQEIDMSAASQVPLSELFAAVNGWIFGAFDAAGAEKDMGSKLLSTFRAAGLPWPEMISTTLVTGGPDSPYYEFLAEMVRSMLPMVERAGLASQTEIGLDSLAQRLREDAVSNERVLFPPRIVGAWCSV